MVASGNWARLCINGYDASPNGMTVSWKHSYMQNPVVPFNIGITQASPGAFEPSGTISAYIDSAVNSNTVFNLLNQSAGGQAPIDIEYLTLCILGQNTLPVMGDLGYCAGFTLNNLNPTIDPKGVLTFQGPMRPRGRYTPLVNALQIYNGPDNATALTAPAFWDSGTNASAGTTKGGGAMLQILTPTGTAATGTITTTSQAVANDTVVVNGVTFTFKAAVSVAGDVLIGAAATNTMQNLYAALTNGIGGNTTFGTQTYVPVSAANYALINTAQFTPPAVASPFTLTVTYKTTGTGGNAYTLVRTGTGGFAVSGATLSGGVTGDTLSFTAQTATSSGGSYTAVATFASTGQVRTAEYIAIPTTTVINEFWKGFVTGGAGQTVSFIMAVGRYWNS